MVPPLDHLHPDQDRWDKKLAQYHCESSFEECRVFWRGSLEELFPSHPHQIYPSPVLGESQALQSSKLFSSYHIMSATAKSTRYRDTKLLC